jgi:guanylate kinase
MSHGGKLIVMAGPSGVGKGTLAKFIVENYSGYHLSVSATTRAARSGEVEGVSYFFVSEPDFMKKVESGQMLEWATVHGKHSYGTPRAAVEEALGRGLNVLLEIDVQGAFQVKDAFSQAVLVFVKPPSFEELRNRLDKRGTESEPEKLVRLRTAEIELERASNFDFVVINDAVARCAQEVVDLIEST